LGVYVAYRQVVFVRFHCAPLHSFQIYGQTIPFGPFRRVHSPCINHVKRVSNAFDPHFNRRQRSNGFIWLTERTVKFASDLFTRRVFAARGQELSMHHIRQAIRNA
jgi:hypothetical protein